MPGFCQSPACKPRKHSAKITVAKVFNFASGADTALLPADSKMLVTACDDMHSHLYDVENSSLVEAFSGNCSCKFVAFPFPCIPLHALM